MAESAGVAVLPLNRLITAHVCSDVCHCEEWQSVREQHQDDTLQKSDTRTYNVFHKYFFTLK